MLSNMLNDLAEAMKALDGKKIVGVANQPHALVMEFLFVLVWSLHWVVRYSMWFTLTAALHVNLRAGKAMEKFDISLARCYGYSKRHKTAA